MAVSVRRIRPEEGQLLRRMRLAALRDSPDAYASTLAAEEGRSEATWDALARARSHGPAEATFWAQDHDGTVVGMVGAHRSDTARGTVELVSLWVDPGHRRGGVGRRLVAWVVDWAAAGGADRVELWVTTANAPAEALYRRSGFVPAPDDPGDPGHACRGERHLVRSLGGEADGPRAAR